MEVAEIVSAALAAIAAAGSTAELEGVRTKYLGRRGELTLLMRGIGQLPPEERREAGQALNQARARVEAALADRQAELARAEEEARLRAEAVDITLPGAPFPVGRPHPLRETWEAVELVFRQMGFFVLDGPEVETDYYNFQALNIPPEHPAREMWDTFYLPGGYLLRTHTSPMQIRGMRAFAPRAPLRLLAPGRVYRRDDDITHSPEFHQIEGLAIDRGLHFGHLKGTLIAFARAVFGPEVKVRLRPSYFPFTEPSAEMDMSCTFCGGRGCRVCKGSGWLEVLGAGMVHPEVLRAGGYDPDRVSGFAFGLGLERLAMRRYGVDDIRLLYQNDVRLMERWG